jgi:hypothetical protein
MPAYKGSAARAPRPRFERPRPPQLLCHGTKVVRAVERDDGRADVDLLDDDRRFRHILYTRSPLKLPRARYASGRLRKVRSQIREIADATLPNEPTSVNASMKSMRRSRQSPAEDPCRSSRSVGYMIQRPVSAPSPEQVCHVTIQARYVVGIERGLQGHRSELLVAEDMDRLGKVKAADRMVTVAVARRFLHA